MWVIFQKNKKKHIFYPFFIYTLIDVNLDFFSLKMLIMLTS